MHDILEYFHLHINGIVFVAIKHVHLFHSIFQNKFSHIESELSFTHLSSLLVCEYAVCVLVLDPRIQSRIYILIFHSFFLFLFLLHRTETIRWNAEQETERG